ncbi:enoyl-CoA hydratase/isomerase family protein [Woodsholea maritima]|uniref:enoyl-CoA hydratase/isomerase family protein n=1 Tax=Woodsholea maritima TaxID=240237 RepID=UPI00035C27A2|nr:enoyl-CoA hydratase-related protein [Woodsholea maritima]
MTDIEGFALRHDGPITFLSLDRAAHKNAIPEAMWLALPGLLTDLAARPACRVLVLEAEGDVFCAGADIREFASVYETPQRAARYSAAIRDGLNALEAFPHPTIAAIQGPCVGGGVALALSCDIKFASDTVHFAITPAKLGLTYPFSDIARLARCVGPSRAKDLLFSARKVSATEALHLNLIDYCVLKSELKNRVGSYAITLSQNSAQSLSAMKTLIAWVGQGQCIESDETRQIFQDAFSSDDFKEGYQAFLDKRPPKF